MSPGRSWIIVFVSAGLTHTSIVIFWVGWKLTNIKWPQVACLCPLRSFLRRLAWASSHGGWEGFWERVELPSASWDLSLELAYFHFYWHRVGQNKSKEKLSFKRKGRRLQLFMEGTAKYHWKSYKYREEWTSWSIFCDLINGKEGYSSASFGLGGVEDFHYLFTSVIMKTISLF